MLIKVVIVGLWSAMSNAALEEGSEEIQEVDIAEIKKLKVCSFAISEQSVLYIYAILTSGARASRKADGTRIECEREQAGTRGKTD